MAVNRKQREHLSIPHPLFKGEENWREKKNSKWDKEVVLLVSPAKTLIRSQIFFLRAMNF